MFLSDNVEFFLAPHNKPVTIAYFVLCPQKGDLYNPERVLNKFATTITDFSA